MSRSARDVTLAPRSDNHCLFVKKYILTFVSYLSVATQLLAFPEIINPRFAMNASQAWPGSAAIAGWVGTWHTGVNPIDPLYQPVFDAINPVLLQANSASQPLD